jgi:hypothetical protein
MHVEVHIDEKQYLYYTSRIHAGLCTLAQRGEITLMYTRTGRDCHRIDNDSTTLCLEVGSPNGRKIAVDLRDRSDIFCRNSLAWCDLYLKRSFHAPDVETLPLDISRKVAPAGPNYYATNPESVARIIRSIGFKSIVGGISSLQRLRTLMVLPRVSDFEQEPTDPVEPTVVFQSRVWEPHETKGEFDATINEERVEILRALRDALGDRFRGGLVPTPTALSHYSEFVTCLPTRRTAYTLWSKRNLIGIYSRGVHHSIAAKLPEYLAASQCIVTEPIRNAMAAPLTEGLHYLPFTSPSECVAACRRVIEDPSYSATMQRANHDYYIKYIEPSAYARAIVRAQVHGERKGLVYESVSLNE